MGRKKLGDWNLQIHTIICKIILIGNKDLLCSAENSTQYTVRPIWQQVPFLAPGTSFCGRQFFHKPSGRGDGFRMIQVHFIYCVLYFCSCISSTSDHQALDPGAWGPLLYGKITPKRADICVV